MRSEKHHSGRIVARESSYENFERERGGFCAKYRFTPLNIDSANFC
jgi:hypothetical protein